MTTPGFEQGPIRPPSEAHSLLVRVIRNCTWNRCTFCPVYKGSKASQRSLEEILADVEAMAAAAQRLGGPHASVEGLLAVLHSGEVPPEAMQVALFLRDGARHAFLQDADPCAVRPEKLLAVLERVHERFRQVRRVTTYARASTLARRRMEDLAALAAAGLTRVHVGLESGSDQVLRETCKGATQAESIEAGRKALQAGLELCFYVMPGLGGVAAAEEHVRGTAEVIRAVAPAAAPQRPLVVRLRTTALRQGTPLAERAARGEFSLPDDVQAMQEVRALLEQIDGARLELRSDHSLNLLSELEGSLPGDRERLLGLIDEFLELPAHERAMFALGVRVGVYRRLADRRDPERRSLLASHVPGADEAGEEELLEAAQSIRARFI